MLLNFLLLICGWITFADGTIMTGLKRVHFNILLLLLTAMTCSCSSGPKIGEPLAKYLTEEVLVVQVERVEQGSIRNSKGKNVPGLVLLNARVIANAAEVKAFSKYLLVFNPVSRGLIRSRIAEQAREQYRGVGSRIYFTSLEEMIVIDVDESLRIKNKKRISGAHIAVSVPLNR